MELSSFPLKQLREPKPSKVSFRIIRFSKKINKEIEYYGTDETKVVLPKITDSYLEDCFAVGAEQDSERPRTDDWECMVGWLETRNKNKEFKRIIDNFNFSDV
ncbi:MAG: hypothetical protein ACFFCZ_27350 [Promethearchaeota archaeon]